VNSVGVIKGSSVVIDSAFLLY